MILVFDEYDEVYEGIIPFNCIDGEIVVLPETSVALWNIAYSNNIAYSSWNGLEYKWLKICYPQFIPAHIDIGEVSLPKAESLLVFLNVDSVVIPRQEPLVQEVVKLTIAGQGNKIKNIKAVRAILKIGLKEAKDFVEEREVADSFTMLVSSNDFIDAMIYINKYNLKFIIGKSNA